MMTTVAIDPLLPAAGDDFNKDTSDVDGGEGAATDTDCNNGDNGVKQQCGETR